MKLNWKYVRSPKTIRYIACDGPLLFKEFKDICTAAAFENISGHEFENSIFDFIKEQREIFEAITDKKPYEQKIPIIKSSEFRAEQWRINLGRNKK